MGVVVEEGVGTSYVYVHCCQYGWIDPMVGREEDERQLEVGTVTSLQDVGGPDHDEACDEDCDQVVVKHQLLIRHLQQLLVLVQPQPQH